MEEFNEASWNEKENKDYIQACREYSLEIKYLKVVLETKEQVIRIQEEQLKVKEEMIGILRDLIKSIMK